MSFASYAFNKSHAAAYAVCAYETAYLKRYYPVQFIAAVINNRITNQDEIAKYVEYLRSSGVTIYPPDINISDVYFKCENGGLRYGLMGIKNVGESAITTIVEERNKNGKFESLENLIKRSDKTSLNKRMLESLIKAGALDCFGETRATLIVNYDQIITVSNHDKAITNTGQMTLFDDLFGEEESSSYKMVKINEYPKNDILSAEKDMLNIYLSGHPLDEYRSKYATESFTLHDIKPILDAERESAEDSEMAEENEDSDLCALIKEYDKQPVSLGGMITDVRIRVTKSNKSMAMVRLEDLHSSIDLVFFPTSFDKYRHLLVKDKIVKVEGELQVSGRSQIVARGVKEWFLDETSAPQVQEKKAAKLYINIADNEESTLSSVLSVLKAYPGMIPVILKYQGQAMKCQVRVQNTEAMFSELAGIVGEENYKLV